MYRNAKNVGYYMIGQGSLSQLGDLLAARRKAGWTVPQLAERYFLSEKAVYKILAGCGQADRAC